MLSAPLAPNINHRSTAFGGSISTAAILSAWSWLHFTLRERGLDVRLVIQSNHVDYLEPVVDAFEAECRGVEPAQLDRFCRMLARHGRARLTLKSVVRCCDVVGATFSGKFVALAQA